VLPCVLTVCMTKQRCVLDMPRAVAGHAGGFVQGWEQQFSLLADNVSASLPLHKRTPQAGNRPCQQLWLAQLSILGHTC